MSLFWIMASISIGLSSGTMVMRDCPVVTTCPMVVTGSCCTVPAMGARSLTRSFLDCALISSCSRRSGLALGLGELLHLVGNELGGRLLDLALERGEGSQRLGQLAALAHLGRHLRLVLRQRVDHQRPRRRPLIDEALTHV